LLKSDGQWANYSALGGQNYVKFDIQKNIWYNCGQNIIRRLAGGRFGSKAPRTFYQNTYFNDGVDISASEASYDDSGTALTSDPSFKNPANGDFTLNVYSQQADERTGDPRWYRNGTYVGPTAIESIEAEKAADLENATIYNMNGQRVEKAGKGLYIINGKKVVMK